MLVLRKTTVIVLVIRGRPVYRITATIKDETGKQFYLIWPGSDKGIFKGKDES